MKRWEVRGSIEGRKEMFLTPVLLNPVQSQPLEENVAKGLG